MKIRTCAALLIALLILSVSGGFAATTVEDRNVPDQPAARMHVEVIEEPAIPLAETPVSVQPSPVKEEPAPRVPAESIPVETAPVQTQPPETEAAVSASGAITKEEAKAIALQHAGVAEEQVIRLRVRYDRDDRVPEYEVEFHEGIWEYDYEIHAETGTILSWEKDD